MTGGFYDSAEHYPRSQWPACPAAPEQLLDVEDVIGDYVPGAATDAGGPLSPASSCPCPGTLVFGHTMCDGAAERARRVAAAELTREHDECARLPQAQAADRRPQ